MANRTGKRGKKPLQTTLGKASGQNEKEVDLSHVQKPIHTSVFGLRQVLSLFQTATEEVQNYITYECDIMYECRTCRTIFRSLANFILHKRNYCRERFRHFDLLHNEETNHENECTGNTYDTNHTESRPVTPIEKNPVPKDLTKNLAPVIEKLREKQEIHQLAQEVLSEDLSSKENVDLPNKHDDKRSESNDVLLETIATNNAAVFQTMLQNLPAQPSVKLECMRSEVMEIHGILESDEAVIGPDGKICNFETNKINENPIIPKSHYFCSECNLKFSTKKTLTYHIKYKHNHTRLIYVCPDCKDTFANAWCVYRHLYKIHRKTTAQIKRMRDQIHNSYIRRDQEPAKKKDKRNLEKVDKTDEENQWLNNIEGDNDFQMCGGCGKRFERKAALHSHAQMCTKRIAVCNTIKENNAKKKEEEFKENKNKMLITEKTRPSEVLKGSLKRKPYIIRTYKPSDKPITENPEAILPQEICDVNDNCEIMESNCDSPKTIKEENHNKNERRTFVMTTENLLSPKDICASPSVDSIDTEKMFNIIGVTSLSENLNTNIDKKELYSSEKELAKNSAHTAINFDMFCQNIAEQLEIGNNFQKSSKTVPLILRRKNSAKFEKRNSILDQKNKESSIVNREQDTGKLNEDSVKIDVLEYENVETFSEPHVLENAPSTSTFRISVKSLEDLKGISQEHIENSENKEIPVFNEGNKNSVNIQSFNYIASEEPFSEVSDTIRANISPEKFRKKIPKPLKRKRTSSFDYARINKSPKRNMLCLSIKQDVSFISKASPYMDQNKLLCIPCQLSYTTLSKLLWHMSAHFSWFRFQCSRCSFISFNKFDCANHARRNHNAKKKSMQSVVLPIPNWKTVLMAHDFCMLKDENVLSGKHTDEILFGNQENAPTESEIQKRKDDEVVSDSDSNLFADIKSLDSETDSYCDNASNRSSIKQEDNNVGIDIIDDSDSHQIEVPQEIYTLDVAEIMNGVEDREEDRLRFMPYIKTEKIENDDETEGYYIPKENQNEVTKKIKSEVTSDDEVAEKRFNCKDVEGASKPHTDLKRTPDVTINIRPTRNRMRSIKTLQDDFFYDMNKVIKLNDNSVTKPGSQKNKKNNQSNSQKTAKESVASSSKNETKSMRVYSKKK